MINIFRSIIYSLVGLSVVGWVSILLISVMLVGPDPDSFLTQYFADNIIVTEKVEILGYTFAEISEALFESFAVEDRISEEILADRKIRDISEILERYFCVADESKGRKRYVF